MELNDIKSIRILPNDKKTFPTLNEFEYFIKVRMVNRGGYYYFPNLMMKCPNNTLVLFQYDGMIRAVGVLIDKFKSPIKDERGFSYNGRYQFDLNTLVYLKTPLDKEDMQRICSLFKSFNQCKQRLPLECLNKLLKELK